MHIIWRGAISFGLINIPVNLYNGAEERELHFRMLHKTDHAPIKYIKMCSIDKKPVSSQDIVKGFEYEKDQFVILTEKDFEAADARATHVIDILEFSKENEFDIRYFQKPYYLEAGKGAEKAYVLLREALHKSKKVAITKFVLHNREHLGMIKAMDKILVLNILRFPTEIRSIEEVATLQNITIKPQEMEMAISLINQLTEKFKPEKFHDTYTEELEKLIQKKIAGEKPVVKGKIPKTTKVKDLMAVLKASLEQTKVKSTKTRTRKKGITTQRKKAA